MNYQAILDVLLWNYQPHHGILFGSTEFQLGLVKTNFLIRNLLMSPDLIDWVLNRVVKRLTAAGKEYDMDCFEKGTSLLLGQSNFIKLYESFMHKSLTLSPVILTTDIPLPVGSLEPIWKRTIFRSCIDQANSVGIFDVDTRRLLENCHENHHEPYHGRLIGNKETQNMLVRTNLCEWKRVYFRMVTDVFINTADSETTENDNEDMVEFAKRAIIYIETKKMRDEFCEFIRDRIEKHPEILSEPIIPMRSTNARNWRRALFQSQIVRAFEMGFISFDYKKILRVLHDKYQPFRGRLISDEKVQLEIVKLYVKQQMNFFDFEKLDELVSKTGSLTPTKQLLSGDATFFVELSHSVLTTETVQSMLEEYIMNNVAAHPEIIETEIVDKAETEHTKLQEWLSAVCKSCVIWAYKTRSLGINVEQLCNEMLEHSEKYHGRPIGDESIQCELTKVIVGIHSGIHCYEGIEDIIQRTYVKMYRKTESLSKDDIMSFADEIMLYLSSKEFLEAHENNIWNKFIVRPEMILTHSAPNNSDEAIKRECRIAIVRACILYFIEKNMFGLDNEKWLRRFRDDFNANHGRLVEDEKFHFRLLKHYVAQYSDEYFSDKLDSLFDRSIKFLGQKNKHDDLENFASATFYILKSRDIKKDISRFVRNKLKSNPDIMMPLIFRGCMHVCDTEVEENHTHRVLERQLTEAYKLGNIIVDSELILDELLRIRRKYHGRLIGKRDTQLRLVKINMNMQIFFCRKFMFDKCMENILDNLRKENKLDRMDYFEIESFLYLNKFSIRAAIKKYIWERVTKLPEIITTNISPDTQASHRHKTPELRDYETAIVGSFVFWGHIENVFDFKYDEILDNLYKKLRYSPRRIFGDGDVQSRLIEILVGVHSGAYFFEGHQELADEVFHVVDKDGEPPNEDYVVQKVSECLKSLEYIEDCKDYVLNSIRPSHVSTNNTLTPCKQEIKESIFCSCVEFANRTKVLGFDANKILDEMLEKHGSGHGVLIGDREEQRRRVKHEIRKHNVKHYTKNCSEFMLLVQRMHTAEEIDMIGYWESFTKTCFRFLKSEASYRETVWKKITSNKLIISAREDDQVDTEEVLSSDDYETSDDEDCKERIIRFNNI